MNRFPRINFIVSGEREKETAAFFIRKFSKTSPMFFDKFIKDFPELAKIKSLDEDAAIKFVNKKIDHYYDLNENKLLAEKKIVEERWNKIKDTFFVEAEKIFDNNKWPIGEYSANLSLFGMFRLIPGTKKFSIPSEDMGGNPPSPGHINHVIVHEMMHILFEDFYKKYFDNQLEKQKYFGLLEIINCIVLNRLEIINLTKWSEIPYPQYKEVYEQLKPIYEKSDSMREFCEKAIIYLNT